jgi:hypothetical protein
MILGAFIYAAGQPSQKPLVQSVTAPPPAKVISAEEKNILTATKDPKSRVKKTIELAEAHLTKAEAHTSQEHYSEASAEVGKYWALMDDILNHLSTLKRDSNKTRDLYKRVELSLRAHGPRLTNVRRNTPLEYSVWVKEIEEFARDGRSEALNSFYGHTVLREAKSAKEKPAEKKANGTSAPPESKEP